MPKPLHWIVLYVQWNRDSSRSFRSFGHVIGEKKTREIDRNTRILLFPPPLSLLQPLPVSTQARTGTGTRKESVRDKHV